MVAITKMQIMFFSNESDIYFRVISLLSSRMLSTHTEGTTRLSGASAS